MKYGAYVMQLEWHAFCLVSACFPQVYEDLIPTNKTLRQMSITLFTHSPYVTGIHKYFPLLNVSVAEIC